MSGMMRKLRAFTAMMLAVMMLVSSTAFAAPVMNLPSMLRSIEDEAFMGDTSIENVVIPESVTSIGAQAFAGCTALQTVTVPDSVTSIGEDAFAGCEGVTIVCSYESAAAVYARANGIRVQYTDVTPVEFSWKQPIKTAYVGNFFGNVVATGEVLGYDDTVHEEIVWALERIDENADGAEPLYLVPEGTKAFVRLAEQTRTLEATYRLSATVGQFTDAFEFTLSVIQKPADLPTAFEMTATQFEVGQTLNFTKDCLRFTDGSVSMADECVVIDVAVEEMPIYTENAGQMTEDGFTVTFAKEDTYVIPVWLMVNNAGIYADLVVTVGTGVPQTASLSLSGTSSTVFTNMEGSPWLLSASLQGVELLEGEEVQWTVESKTGEGLVDVFVGYSWNGGASLNVSNPSGETGEETFVVTATLRGQAITGETTVMVVECPETLPEADDVIVPENYYILKVGETVEFNYNEMIGLAEGSLPEGMTWLPETGVDGLYDQEGFAWSETGFTFTATQTGVYSFEARARLSVDYAVVRTIPVVVMEEEELESLYVQIDLNTNVAFNDLCEDIWVGHAYLQGFPTLEGVDVAWEIVSLGEVQLIDLYGAGVEPGSTYASQRLHVSETTGEVGVEPFEVIAHLGNYTYSAQTQMTVMERPEVLPTDADVTVEPDLFVINAGESVEILGSQISLDTTNLPDGLTWKPEFHYDMLPESVRWEWMEDGSRFVFEEDGVYRFYAAARLAANYAVRTPITVVVGQQDYQVNWNDNSLTMFRDCGDMWVTDVYVWNYTTIYGDELTWELSRVDESAYAPVELFFMDIWDEGLSAGIHARQIGDEPGSDTWRLVARDGDTVVVERELTVTLTDQPENLPTDMWVENDDYHIEVGEEFVFTTDMFGIGEGEIPEGMKVSKEFWTNDAFLSLDGIECIENGFRVQPQQDGRYYFDAAVMLGNCQFSHRITLTVGTGISPDLEVVWKENTGDLYLGGHDVWVYDVSVSNYIPPVGMDLEWTFEMTSGTEPAVAEPFFPFVEYDGEGNHYARINANIMTGELGECTWIVRAAAGDELVLEREFTLRVLPFPEELYIVTEVDAHTYYVEENETFTYYFDYFRMGEGTVLPEGAKVARVIYPSEALFSNESFRWIEGNSGFEVAFGESGRYAFEVGVQIHNYTETETINIIVGEGPQLQRYMPSETLLTQENFDQWLANYRLDRFHWNGDQIDWQIELVTETDVPVANVYIGGVWEDTTGVDLHVNELSGETGSVTYRITAGCGELSWSDEFTLTVIDNTVEMPGNDAVTVPVEYFEINEGDQIYFKYEDIAFDETLLPEGMSVTKELWLPELSEADVVEHREDGILVTFNTTGRYEVTAAVCLAVNYTLTRSIAVIVGDGNQSAAELYCAYIENPLYPIACDGHHSSWALLNFNILSTDNVEWKLERFTDEYSPEEPLVELYIEWISDERQHLDVFMTQPREEYATELYFLTCVVNGEEIARAEIHAAVEPTPENLPTALWVESAVYQIEPGSGFAFDENMYGIADGEIPEGAQMRWELWIDEHLASQQGFDRTESAFSVEQLAEGVYRFEVALRIGNYCVSQPVTLIVGDGAQDYEVHWNDNAMTMFRDCGDMWVTDVHVSNYTTIHGDELTWELSRVDESAYAPVELFFMDIWDAGWSAGIHARQIGDEPGSDTWRLVARDGDVVVVERELTVTLTDLPENLPTDMWVENDDYHIEVGEEFVFTREMFGIGEGEIPEGINVNQEFWMNEAFVSLDGFEWIDNGFRVQPQQDGRYYFNAAVMLGNYGISHRVTLTVGTGVSPDFRVDWIDRAFDLYRDLGDAWAFDVCIRSYAPPAGMDIEWVLYRPDESAEMFVEAYIADVWEDGLNVRVQMRQVNDKCGSDNWILEARVGDEIIHQRSVQLSLLDLPEDFPTAEDIWVESEEYRFEVGDAWDYTTDCFGFNDGVDADDFLKEIITDYRLESQEFYWLDDGFRVIFHQEGRYVFQVMMEKNNYRVTREIRVIVGDGVSENTSLQVHQYNDTFYLGENENLIDIGYGVDVELRDYILFEGESIDWEIVRVSENETPALDTFLAAAPEGSLFATLCFNNVAALGEETFRVIAHTPTGDYAAEFSVTVTDDFSALPTELVVHLDTQYQLGDHLIFHWRDTQELVGGSGEWTMDNAVFNQGLTDSAIGWDNECWRDGQNINIIFHNEDTYDVTFQVMLGNYCLQKDLRIVVGSGVRGDCELIVEHLIHEVYPEGINNCWVADAWLQNYTLLEGEECRWNLDWVEGSENLDAELYIDSYMDHMPGVRIHAVAHQPDAWAHYVLTVETDRFSQSRDLWINSRTKPEELPSGLALEATEYHLEIGDTLTLAPNFATTDDGWIPDGAYVRDDFWFAKNAFLGEEVVWHDDGSFSVTFTDNGRHVLQAQKWINNYLLQQEIVVYVGTGLSQHVALKQDVRFDSAYAYVDEENLRHYVSGLWVEGYCLAPDEQIEWTMTLQEPAEGEEPVQLFINGVGDQGSDIYVCMHNMTGETGRVVYLVEALLPDGTILTDTVSLNMIENIDTLPTGLTGFEMDVYLNPGDTYVFDASLVQLTGGTVPEGVTCYLEYFSGMDYLEYMPGFQWLENESFQVTFPRDGYFEFVVAYRFNASQWATETVRITIGEGAPENPVLSVNTLADYVFVEGVSGSAFEVYLNGYTPYDGENMLWEIEHIDGDSSCVYLEIVQIRDNDCTIHVNAVVGNGEVGEASYRVHITTESGYRDFVDYTVRAISTPEVTPGEISFPEINIPVGETFTFYPEDYVRLSGDYMEGLMYHFIVYPDDALRQAEGFELMFDGQDGMENGFVFTPTAENRYCVTVSLMQGNWFSRNSFTLNVGDGIADDVYVNWYQSTETVYMHPEQDYMFAGADLYNYNRFENEDIRWHLERVDQSEGSPVDVYLEDFDESCVLRYGSINSVGSVTYRVTLETDSGFTDSCEFTLNVEELPEGLPTELNFSLPTHYEIGETMSFVDEESLTFAGGTVPENASVRTIAQNLHDQPIWYENSGVMTESGFDITFTRNGRYQLPLRMLIGNYSVEYLAEITVGTGVADDIGPGLEQYIHKGYVGGRNDHYIGSAFLHGYTCFSGEEIWTLERLDDRCESSAELYIIPYGNMAEIYITNVDDCGTGYIAYRLHMETWTGYTAEMDVVVAMENLPEGLPTRLDIDGTNLEFTVGEHFEIPYGDVSFSDGSVPEYAFERCWLTNIEGSDLMNNNFVQYDVHNLWIDFHTPGVYELEITRTLDNYGVTGVITLTVNEPEAYLEARQPTNVIFANVQDYCSQYIAEDAWMGDAELRDYQLQEGEQVEWSCEPVGLAEGETPVVDVYIADHSWNDGMGRRLEYGSINGVGESTWRVTARVGDQSWSADYTYTVTEVPENMPTCLALEKNVSLAVNEYYAFDTGSIAPGDGEIPENVGVRREVWGISEALHNHSSFRWTENGFEFTATEENSYVFEPVLIIGNYVLIDRVGITVGDGIADDVGVELTQVHHTIYRDTDQIWVCDANVQNYWPADSSYIQWTLELAQEEENPAVNAWIEGSWNENTAVYICARQGSGETGSTTYILTCRILDSFEYSCELTLHMEEKPDNLPTALNMGDIPTMLELNVGDTYTFESAGVTFADGEVPEGAVVRDELWDISENFFWNEGFIDWRNNNGVDGAGLSVTFTQEGRYRFRLCRQVNSHYVFQEIAIIVGDVPTSGFSLRRSHVMDTAYTNGDHIWQGWWALEDGFTLFDQDEVEWTLSRITDENSPEEPVANVILADMWGGRNGINLHMTETGEATGTETYRLACLLNGEELAADEFTITVVERPENLPTAITGIEAECSFALGETFELRYDTLGFADGTAPEDAYVRWEIWNCESLPNMQYLDNDEGIVTTFTEDNAYFVTVVAFINNVRVEKNVVLLAGTGISADAYVSWFDNGSTWYAIPGNLHGFGAAQVNNYYLRADDEITWSVEVVEGSHIANVYMPNSGRDGNHWIDLHVTDFTGETGTLVYRLSVSTLYGFKDQHDYTMNVVELPADIPTGMTVGETSLTMRVGDTYTFDLNQVGFGEGVVPEDAWIYHWLDTGNLPVQWLEEGVSFEATFTEAGEYVFWVDGNINNYQLCEEIVIVVTD